MSPYKIRLKKNDTVVVRSGKYKGQSGKIISVLPRQNMAIVEGINIAKKHSKPTKANPQGGIIDITKPIYISKLGFQDPVSKKPTRVGYHLSKDGSKQRYAKASGKEINS